ncbi:hypothetical protein BC939DRAFT_500399 [Gamsiella multidivaricata]|uniref:uncharacterized protein n=1 Tax=Gamsiella multidivaricata TaxID=101098 RepID=UPI0022211CDB|nr:uncharacterized protein BC939DRAFT_500399 [Gamsiella multidivaricata]KAI7828949.1 hypothetical protein BC939DRAFT_500399 [Gamsiella multidivaricata]
MEPAPAGTSSVQRAAALASVHASRQSTSSLGNTSSNSHTGTTSGTSSRRHSHGQADSSSADTGVATFLKELETISSRSKQQPQQLQQQQAPSFQAGSASASTTPPASGPSPVYQEPNRCYICFGTEEDSVGRWVKPCQCTLISHEDCLLDWIDKNRQQFAKKQVRCSVCNTVYRLAEPSSLLLNIYSTFDSLVHAGIPYLTFLGLTCSVLITSTTYGAYAVLTICGTEEGEKLLGSPNPWSWRVWTGLPLIPVILIFSRTKLIDSFLPMIPLLIVGNDQLQVTFPPSPALTLSVMPWIRMAYNSLWTEMVTRLETRWRHQQIAGSGVARLGMNASIDSSDADTLTTVAAAAQAQAGANVEEELSFFDRRDLGRTIVGALLMPAISSICGSFLGHFSFVRTRIPDNFHRNILGGCLFVVIKDLASLVGTYQEMKRRRVRRIREYSEFKDERQ